MGEIGRTNLRRALGWVGIAALLGPATSAGAPERDSARSLFAQSATVLLARQFADPKLSYLLLDARTGGVIARRWQQKDAPVPVGSLIKPFTAVAFARTHQAHFPEHYCTGGDTCWLPHGHGREDLRRAIANSCNSYFRALAKEIPASAANQVFAEFGITPPPAPAGVASLARDSLIGLDNSWRMPPLQLARAYLRLQSEASDPGVRQVLAGMAESARSGTGRGAGRQLHGIPVLTKTGTAACTHGVATGDGFALVLFPADIPTMLLLVRIHNAPGSHAAVTAGEILHALHDNPVAHAD